MKGVITVNKDKKLLIGKMLRKAREATGMTQVEVAKIRGYSSTATVPYYESGKRTPDAFELYELSKLYGVSMYFFHGEQENQPKKDNLTKEENELVENYRQASERDKDLTLRILKTSAVIEQTE
jgi:transcriptional regulator with XRE-family HTH domain